MKFGLHAGGFGRRVRFDPYYPWVLALVPMEGTNGSTTFTDIKNGVTFTAAGTVAVSNAQSRTGQGTSALFNGGTSDYIQATLTAFGTDAYNVELSMRPTSNSDGGFGSLASSSDTLVGASFWIVGGSGSNRIRIGKSVSGQYDDFIDGLALSNGTWYDIKHLRSNSTAYLYVNNTLRGSVSSSRTLDATAFRVGAPYYNDTSSMFSGYASWLRVTKGADRGSQFSFPPYPTNA